MRDLTQTMNWINSNFSSITTLGSPAAGNVLIIDDTIFSRSKVCQKYTARDFAKEF